MRPLQDFPAGFRFVPTEQDLMLYLRCKVQDEQLPRRPMLPLKEINIYNVKDPGDLFMDSQEDVVYVFTKFQKLVKDGKRFNRRVGNCTWKVNDKDTPVFHGQIRMGSTKNFSYEKEKVKLGYIMKEFTLDDTLLKHAKLPDYVLCLIKRKAKLEGKSKDENLQEGIVVPQLPMPDEYDNYALPTFPIASNYNDMAASCSLVPYNPMQQYQKNNDHQTTTSVSWLPSNELVYQDQYQDVHQENSDRTIAYVPWPSSNELVCQNQYQDMLQEENEPIHCISSLFPSYEGNPYHEDLLAITQPDQETDKQVNHIRDMDLIMELIKAPPLSSLDDDLDYDSMYPKHFMPKEGGRVIYSLEDPQLPMPDEYDNYALPTFPIASNYNYMAAASCSLVPYNPMQQYQKNNDHQAITSVSWLPSNELVYQDQYQDVHQENSDRTIASVPWLPSNELVCQNQYQDMLQEKNEPIHCISSLFPSYEGNPYHEDLLAITQPDQETDKQVNHIREMDLIMELIKAPPLSSLDDDLEYDSMYPKHFVPKESVGVIYSPEHLLAIECEKTTAMEPSPTFSASEPTPTEELDTLSSRENAMHTEKSVNCNGTTDGNTFNEPGKAR